MLKSRIAQKLSLYFAMALLIFSVIISSVFMFLFRSYTVNIHKTDLQTRAASIATTLSDYMNRTESYGMGGGMGYGAYMRFIGDIAGTDVWIVDENLNLITGVMGQSPSSVKYNYADLPENAEKLIKDVFTNKTMFSESFSSMMSELTLTVGVPIKNSSGDVWGVVLLHSPVNGTNQAIRQGFFILGMSILLALFISFGLSVLFSYSFTKPLNKMNTTALCLAEGDYKAQSGVTQKDEIGQLANTLDILAERLDVASCQSAKLEQMRRDFVANISHELRTPITVMRGSLEALTEKVVTAPEKVEEYHIQMLSEAKFLQRLVGDLLDLSRLQNMDFVIEKTDVSLSDVISDVARSAEKLAQKKGVRVAVNRLGGGCAMLGDYGRLRQMFMIVLDNAIKFSPEGADVEVTVADARIEIKDCGCGIEDEHLPYIFDRFYKSRSEQNKTGTGLGLAIAKQIADRHGIGLSAENNADGVGAKFVFEIPQK